MGSGRDFSVKHHTQLVCDFCDGRGWVPLATCRGCGKPAFKFWPALERPILRFCGKEDCFTKLIKIHKWARPVLKGFVPATIVVAGHEIDKANRRFDPKDEMERYRLSLLGDGGQC
jgi:hypothetical protein